MIQSFFILSQLQLNNLALLSQTFAGVACTPPSSSSSVSFGRPCSFSRIPQARPFSIWPRGSSPAPIIGPDGQLERSGLESSNVQTSSSPISPDQPPSNPPSSLVSPPPLENQSPTSTILSPSAETDPSLPPSSLSASPVLPDKSATILDNFPLDFAETVEETRRTLSDYGIGGTGFIGRTQELLEWTHVTTGLPWYLTIGVVVIGIRILLLPILVKGMASNARFAHIQPTMMGNIQKIKRAKEEGDMVEVQRVQLATKQLLTDNNCHPLKGLIPPLVQMPLFIIFFVALRRMVAAGLPDFSTGGVGWFTDLSAPDPYYVLPVLSSAATLAVLQVCLTITVLHSFKES